MTTAPPTPGHEHTWQAAGTVAEDQVSYSPVSALDHGVRTITYAVMTCSCGEVRKQAVAASRWRWLNRRNA